MSSLLVFSWTQEPLIRKSEPAIFCFRNISRTKIGGSLNFQRTSHTKLNISTQQSLNPNTSIGNNVKDWLKHLKGG
jgi:hypothetical protein